MKSPKTQRQDMYKRTLKELLDKYPDAHKVSERYRVMRYLLVKEWLNLINQISPDSMTQFLKDVVYIDRQIRHATEGEETETKEILAQEKEMELGYEPTMR